MKTTLWEVCPYGNSSFVVIRYGVGAFEWLGGKAGDKPKMLYDTLEAARAARDKANGPKVPLSVCCGLVLTRNRCPCGKAQK